jgi:hypothetical protein
MKSSVGRRGITSVDTAMFGMRAEQILGQWVLPVDVVDVVDEVDPVVHDVY